VLSRDMPRMPARMPPLMDDADAATLLTADAICRLSMPLFNDIRYF